MATKLAPTRANLIKSQTKLDFSNKGYNLLDQKRTILIQEIMQLVEEAERIEGQIEITFKEAYAALQDCAINLGINKIEDYSLALPEEQEYELRTRSVMGVNIPEIVLEEQKTPLQPMGFSGDSPSLDMAIEKFNEVKELSYQLAQVENTAFKLSQEIKKTSKSANALSKIQIPKLEETIHSIEDSIEEKEREENFRIKKVKKHNQRKRE